MQRSWGCSGFPLAWAWSHERQVQRDRSQLSSQKQGLQLSIHTPTSRDGPWRWQLKVFLCQEPAACRATSSRVILFFAVQCLGYERLKTKPSIHLMRAHVITASFLPHPPIRFPSSPCPAPSRSHPRACSEVVPAPHPAEERTVSTCWVCEGEGTLPLPCALAGLGSTPEPLWPRGRQHGSSLWGPNMAPGERACPAQTHLRWR